MSRRRGRATVRTIRDIPLFSSEDEERDWWATHELGEELLAELRPGQADLADLMPIGLRAAEAPQVQLPLWIAKKHLAYIRRAGERPLRISTDVTRDDARLHHALVSIVFSAAAVEAGLNLYITAPALLVSDEKLRRFFGLLSSKYARLSVPQKLSFVGETYPTLRSDPLVGKIRELFNRRNELVHAQPLYADVLDIRDDVLEELEREPDRTRKVSAQDFEKLPSLVGGGGLSSEDIGRAFEYYEAAASFLDLLRLGPE
jgi:hypothetical protein